MTRWCWENGNQIKYIETSAAENIGVEDGFTELIRSGLKIERSKIKLAPEKASGWTKLNRNIEKTELIE